MPFNQRRYGNVKCKVDSRRESPVKDKTQGHKGHFHLKCFIVLFAAFAVCTAIGVGWLFFSFNSAVKVYETRVNTLEDINRSLRDENSELLNEKNLQWNIDWNYVQYGIQWDKLLTAFAVILALILVFILFTRAQDIYFALQKIKLSNKKQKDFLQINESAKTDRIVVYCENGVNLTGNICNALTFGWSRLLSKVGVQLVEGYLADKSR